VSYFKTKTKHNRIKTEQNIFKQQNKTNQNAERHSKFTTHQNKTVAIFVVDAV